MGIGAVLLLNSCDLNRMGSIAGLSQVIRSGGGNRVRFECGITKAETVLDRINTEFE